MRAEAPSAPVAHRSILAAFALAVALPTLLAFNVPPSATVLNQLAAVGLWGVVVAGVAFRAPPNIALRSTTALAAVFLGVGVAIRFAWPHGPLPSSLALSALAFVLVSFVVMLHGASTKAGAYASQAFFCAWVIVGGISAAIALIQVFHPEWAGGSGGLIARSGLAGRAVGNVRQPNHLSALLLWSALSVVPLLESRRLSAKAGMGLVALFVFAIELSASRTGLIGVCVFAAWGVFDRRLTGATRTMLILTPVAYGIGWYAMSLWAEEGHHTFGAAARLAEKDLSGSRFGIWRDTLDLIRIVPWTGVGFGQFNYAWSLTPFPHRPVAFFDHTHNIGLQFVVELGIPVGILLSGMLLAALTLAFIRTWQVRGEAGTSLRAAFVGVFLMAIHSALEYPLWYGYFLLPTVWAWGYTLGGGVVMRRDEEASKLSAYTLLMRLAGIVMVVSAIGAVFDYLRVAHIFESEDDTSSLELRIIEGQRSVLFSHHADYANATVVDRPSLVWRSFGQAPYYLLDTRLMMAWAKAFAERGDLDRARHIAQRLREFHNPASDEFFAPCDKPDAPEPKPWQCQPPSKYMDWRDFQSLKY